MYKIEMQNIVFEDRYNHNPIVIRNGNELLLVELFDSYVYEYSKCDIKVRKPISDFKGVSRRAQHGFECHPSKQSIKYQIFKEMVRDYADYESQSYNDLLDSSWEYNIRHLTEF